MNTETRPEGQAPAAPPREVPHDFFTHKDSWRNAIANLVKQDGSGYWAHELSAFDRAYAALSAAPAGEPVGQEEDLESVAADIVRLANRMVDASRRDGILRQEKLLPDARNELIDFLTDFPQFVSSGECTCAGPDAPCAGCEANEQAYREWANERDVLRSAIATRAALSGATKQGAAND